MDRGAALGRMGGPSPRSSGVRQRISRAAASHVACVTFSQRQFESEGEAGGEASHQPHAPQPHRNGPAPAASPSPRMVTWVPPARGPQLGVIEETIGGR